MISLVAIRCTDGVVIGADSAITFGTAGGQIGTIEQHTSQKIRVISPSIVVAGTGDLGLMQRFSFAVDQSQQIGAFDNIVDPISFGKKLSSIGICDFSETHLEKFNFSALVAFNAGGQSALCELDGAQGFQPEIKEATDLWYVSSGAGQMITDPFLALLREAFWREGPPNLRGGIFTVLWALTHVCAINTGGIGGPIKIAVLESPSTSGEARVARLLSQSELAEHENAVDAAVKHLGEFRNILAGRSGTEAIPAPPTNGARAS